MAVRVPTNCLYQFGGPPASVWANGFSRLKPASSTWDAPIDANRYNQGELSKSGFRYPSLKAPKNNSEMATSRHPMGASDLWDVAYTGKYNKGELHLKGSGNKYPLLNYPSIKNRFNQFEGIKQDTTMARAREKDEPSGVPSAVTAKKFSMIEILTSLNQMMPGDPKIKEMLETTIRLELTKQSRQLTTDEEALERSIRAAIEKMTEKPLPPQKPVEPSIMPRPGELPPTPADIVTSEDRKRMKDLGVSTVDDFDGAVYKLENVILESDPKDIQKTLDLWDRDFSDFSRLAGNPVSDFAKLDIKTKALQNILSDRLEKIKRMVIGRAPEDLLNHLDDAIDKIDTLDLNQLIEVIFSIDELDKLEEMTIKAANEHEASIKEFRKKEIKKIEDKIKDLEKELKETIKKRDSKNTKRKKRRVLNDTISRIKKDIRKNRNEIKTIKGQPLFAPSKSFPSMSGPSVSFPQPPPSQPLEEEEKEFEDPQPLEEEEIMKKEPPEERVQKGDVVVSEKTKKTKVPPTHIQMKAFRDTLESQKNRTKNTAGYISIDKLRAKASEFNIQVPRKHRRRREDMIDYLLQHF